MTEINEPRAGYEKDLYDLEMDLYVDALERHIGEWIGIHNGKLYHSPDADEIRAELPPGAFTSGQAMVTFIGNPRHPHFHY